MSPRLPEEIPPGIRNSTLTSYAGLLRRYGAGEDRIAAELLATNRSHCRPPLEEREVRSIAKSVAKYPPAGPFVTWGTPPRNLIEVARRRGYRLVDSVTVLDLRRSQFSVGGRRGGGPFRVNLGGPSGPACSCRWFDDGRNLTGTCSHVEAARVYMRLRYASLEGRPDTR